LEKETHVPELKIALTLDKLYVKTWEAPMQKLAAEFGFSDRTASTFLTHLHCLNGLSNYQKPQLLIRRRQTDLSRAAATDSYMSSNGDTGLFSPA
jgi:hypothetical protein